MRKEPPLVIYALIKEEIRDSFRAGKYDGEEIALLELMYE
jgi:hypothetical protein